MISHIVLSFLFAGPVFAALPCKKPVGPRTSPCMPDKAERDAVMGKIEAALTLESNWRDELTAERNLRNALEVAVRRKRDPSMKELETWKENLIRVDKAEIKMRKAFSAVMKATQETYGVGPQKRFGTITGGLLDGQKTAWAPVIQEQADLVYRSDRPGEQPAYLMWQEAAGDGAATMDDGTVFLSLKVLQRAKQLHSPAVLAALIDHEAAHFENLVSKEGWRGFDLEQSRGYRREKDTGEIIGLEKIELERAEEWRNSFWARALPRELADSRLPGGYRAGPLSKDYAYKKQSASDENSKTWQNAQSRLKTIRVLNEEFNARLEARRGEGPGESMRDGLNDSTSSCGGTGWWAGDVYIPALPCPDEVYTPEPPRGPPPDVRAVPAVPPAAAIPAQPPVRAVPVVRLSELAALICADPAAAHLPANHEAYRSAWFSSDDDWQSMPACQREVYLNLKRIRLEGYGDYISQYFQALAERLLNPPVSTIPDIDGPAAPRGPRVPDCLQREGGRCIRWR